MTATFWFIAAGLLLVSLAFTTPLMKRLPVSVPALYLGAGFLLGPSGLGLLSWNVVRDAEVFEHVSEVAVIVSLFTVGLNMRRSLTDRMWRLPVRLATATMALTVAALALVGVLWLDLSLGAAVLLGAILAPTDPVLATDVQLQHATDRDELRYAISGEAGLNDGTAFPFVMLGLGLLGLHPDAESGLLGLWEHRAFSLLGWLGWDVLWAVTTGLFVGAAAGWLVGHAALQLQRRVGTTLGLHEFLVLGLIALAYGLAELIYGYGFLAVFAAGYALRYIELRSTRHASRPASLPAVTLGENAADHPELQRPEKAAHFLAVSLLDFNDKLEHLLMATVVVLVGAVMTTDHWSLDALWLAPLLFLVIRPAAVAVGVLGTGVTRARLGLLGWFGVRGIGSIYYLTYAIQRGVPDPLAERLTGLVLSLIVVSILVHGASVTPLMGWYEGIVRRERERRSRVDPPA